MLNHLQKRKNESGFTIIEVLIVLAIAGLILLIVFLAVPALQRNSRNTQYRQEASRILGATQEFVNNNSGGLPSSAADGTSILTSSNAKNITTLNVVTGSSTAVTPTLTAATVDTGATCPATVSGTSVTPVTSGAPTRALILIYAVESTSGLLAQCTQS